MSEHRGHVQHGAELTSRPRLENAAASRFKRRIDCSDGHQKEIPAASTAAARRGRGVSREKAFPKAEIKES
jgi:hypothetical protein